MALKLHARSASQECNCHSNGDCMYHGIKGLSPTCWRYRQESVPSTGQNASSVDPLPAPPSAVQAHSTVHCASDCACRPWLKNLINKPTSSEQNTQHFQLHSFIHSFVHAARGEFLVPSARLAIMQRRAFSVVGPSAWNELPFELRSLLMAHPSKFYISLKSFFFVCAWAGSASE